MLDMEAVYRTAVLLFVLRVTHISAINVKEYFRAGGTLGLSPTVVPDQIRSILWRHEGNYVAEWIKGVTDLKYYGEFKDRADLNLTTGYLQITRATEADSGVFSVEINDVVQADGYEAVMIRVVPDPYVWLKPGPKPNTYLLYCDPVQDQGADLTAAEPVTYRWKIGTANWVEFGNKLEINVNKTTLHVETFTCQMVNPVSNKTSKTLKNPFYRPGPSPGPGPGPLVAVGVCVGFVVLVVAFCCVFAYKKNKFPFSRTRNAPVSPSEDGTEANKLNEPPE